MRNSKHILTTILVLFLAISAQAQTSVADGNWINGATWGGTSPGYTNLQTPVVDSYVISDQSLFFANANARTLTVNYDTLIVYGDVIFDAGKSNASITVTDKSLLIIMGNLQMGKNQAGVNVAAGGVVVVTGSITDDGTGGDIVSDGKVYAGGTGDLGTTGGSGTVGDLTDLANDIDLQTVEEFINGGGTTPLPVDLVYFKAESSNNSIVLNWKTATEINNDYFLIEKSLDGVSFEELSTISGNGTSNQAIAYEYVDYAVSSSVVYYRLKQVDFDGAFEYFDVIKVNVGSQSENRIYPTLVSDGEINLRGQDLLEIKIFNTRGDILKSEKVLGLNKIEIHSLENGLYFVQVMAASGAVVTERIVVRR